MVHNLGAGHHANSFNEVATKLTELCSNDSTSISTGEYQLPIRFMLGHSIELYLKSYLLQKNFHLKDVMKLGHNLNKIMSECTNKGLEL